MNLSKRVAQLTPSSTLAISAQATELRNQGYDVIGLGVGEPDFNTPEYILQAAKKAMDDGQTKYTQSGGILTFKKTIINKIKNTKYNISGVDIIEPEFNTIEYIHKAEKKEKNDGHTKYTQSGGILPLKKAIINKLKNDNNLVYEPENIIVTTGAKYALFAL